MKKADHQLVQRVLDGDVERGEFDRFQQRMREEPELVQLYGGYSLLHHVLDEEAEGGGFHDFGEVLEHGRSNVPLWIAGVAALLVLAVIAIVRPWGGGAFKEVAAVSFSPDAVWCVEGASRRIGNSSKVTAGSTLCISSGRAEAILDPLLTVVVEGPCRIRFEAGDRCRLLEGRGWFTRRNSGRFTVATPELDAVAEGTEFGVVADPERDDEVHVADGKVRVSSAATGESIEIGSGRAMVVPSSGAMRETPVDTDGFATRLGRFEPVLTGPFVVEGWNVEYGSPSVSAGRIAGSNYAVLAKLPSAVPTDEAPVLIATMEVAKSPVDGFHTEGWAGLSFFEGDTERLFFGDSFGTRASWSLDVKQGNPVMFPDDDVVGPMRVTMRYDLRTGEVSLHEAGAPLAPAFCRGTLPAGARFDGIRLGASSGATIDVTGLEIQVGGGR